MDGSDLVAKSLKSAVRGETAGANLTTMIRSSVAKGNHPKTHHWLIIKSHMESSHSSTNLPRFRLYVSLCIGSIDSIAEECLGYSPIFSHLTLAAFVVFHAEDSEVILVTWDQWDVLLRISAYFATRGACADPKKWRPCAEPIWSSLTVIRHQKLPILEFEDCHRQQELPNSEGQLNVGPLSPFSWGYNWSNML